MTDRDVPPLDSARTAMAESRIRELEAALRQSEAKVHALQAALERGQLADGRSHPEKSSNQAFAAWWRVDLETQVQTLQQQLHTIENSQGWQLLLRYYDLRNRLLPNGSRRSKGAALLFRCIRGILLQLGRVLPGPEGRAQKVYQRWIAQNEPDSQELEKQRHKRFAHEPQVSILVPVYQTPLPFLEAMLESVLAQTYPHWQLCLADGNSPDPDVRRLLQKYADADPRIQVCLLKENQGIAGNSTAALELATGPYVALLDHDDLLSPFALFEVVKAVNDNPDADFLYSDEDHLDPHGQRHRPHFKPDWSPDTLRSHNYICHFVVLRRELLKQVGGFRAGFEGSQDHDLALRATEQARKVIHIPRVLYHWRIHAESFSKAQTRSQATEAGRRAVQAHLDRLGIPASVSHCAVPGVYQVIRELPAQPLVSIVIPSRDQNRLLVRCLDSLRRSSYRRYEILLVENNSKEPETFAYYEHLADRPEVRLLTWEGPFNYAAVNNWAAAQAQGEVLLLLNNDTEVRKADWLERLLEHALRPEVGAVGAKLYYPDGSIQHAGIILGMGGCMGNSHAGWDGWATGYAQRLISTQNLSAVSAACMMLRREVFQEMQGLEERYVLAGSDVDLCLRLREKGYQIIWTPHAELLHHEIKAWVKEEARDRQAFQERWSRVLLAGDPFYNPNLSLEQGGFVLSLKSGGKRR